MKKIDILIPTFNEEENIILLVNELKKIFKSTPQYLWRIIFIDNSSTDSTRELIRSVCKENNNISAIFNSRNFGQIKSPYYGLTQCTGDAVILLYADFQDPPEMILEFAKEWENGYKIVIGKKTKSEENKLMYFLRKCYYKGIKKIADVEHIEQYTGFGLYDKEFIEILKKLDDPMPYLRGIVAELGFKRKEIQYTQNRRKYGKSKYNFYLLYDYGMLGITSYSKVVMRLATIFGFFSSGISLLVAVVYLILKLMYWDLFSAGTAPILIGVFFLGSIQLFFIGLLGEYILNINTRVMKRPLVIEEERINFESNSEENING